MLNGTLIVTGEDCIKINLHHPHHPKHIRVEFVGEPPHVPCDHHHKDELRWACGQKEFHPSYDPSHELDDKDEHDDGRQGAWEPRGPKDYYLAIFWDVASTREIFWEVEW
jgi:hypothetical protein